MLEGILLRFRKLELLFGQINHLTAFARSVHEPGIFEIGVDLYVIEEETYPVVIHILIFQFLYQKSLLVDP